MDKILQYLAGGIGALCAVLWGGLDGLFIALLLVIALDYITGIIAALVTKKLSSQVGWRGIGKKVIIVLLVALANVVDVYVLKTENVLRTAVCSFYLANEGISILENAGRIGLPLPKKLKDALIQLKEDQEAEGFIPTDEDET